MLRYIFWTAVAVLLLILLIGRDMEAQVLSAPALALAPAIKWAWIWFYLGWGVHLFMRADLATLSTLNGVRSRLGFIALQGRVVVVSLFLTTLGFGALIAKPEFVAAAARRVAGVDIGLEIPIAWWSGGAIGFFSDAALQYLVARCGLQKELPPPPPR